MSEVVEATMEQRVDAIVDRYSANKQFGLAVLQDIQRTYNFLPREALERAAQRLDITRGEVYRLATFFTAFSLQPKGDYVIKVCLGTACHVQGGPRLLDALLRELKIARGETTEDLLFGVNTVNCLGCCGLAPVMTVGSDVHGKLKQAQVPRILKKYRTKAEKEEGKH